MEEQPSFYHVAWRAGGLNFTKSFPTMEDAKEFVENNSNNWSSYRIAECYHQGNGIYRAVQEE